MCHRSKATRRFRHSSYLRPLRVVALASFCAGGLALESGYTEGFAFLLVAGVLAVIAATLIPREGAERVAVPRMLAVRS